MCVHNFKRKNYSKVYQKNNFSLKHPVNFMNFTRVFFYLSWCVFYLRSTRKFCRQITLRRYAKHTGSPLITHQHRYSQWYWCWYRTVVWWIYCCSCSFLRLWCFRCKSFFNSSLVCCFFKKVVDVFAWRVLPCVQI